MRTVHLLSRWAPNDPNPEFFEGIEAWVDVLWERGIELHFMEERDLSPNARQWRWTTLTGDPLELVVCDDLSVGARELILEGHENSFQKALPELEERLAFEPYEEALQRAKQDPHSALALLRACVASPRPPRAELEELVAAALSSPDAELRYRAVSGAVTLQSASMERALARRLEDEDDPRVQGILERGIASFRKSSS